jgi:hypothetical protein
MELSKSVAELQREHVVLELECIDRMYVNAYVPQLTSEAGVAGFVRGHLLDGGIDDLLDFVGKPKPMSPTSLSKFIIGSPSRKD